jgi:hypothetical protein
VAGPGREYLVAGKPKIHITVKLSLTQRIGDSYRVPMQGRVRVRLIAGVKTAAVPDSQKLSEVYSAAPFSRGNSF